MIDIDKTLDNFGASLETRLKQDHSARDMTPEQAIKTFQQYDPTNNDQYTLWAIRTYLNKGINYLEDLSRLKSALSLFHKHKSKLSVKDIGQIKYLNQLESLVEPFEGEQTSNELKKEEKEKIYSETEVIYKGNEGTIVSPKTQASSCYWGKGTRWCTAATRSDNMFSHYNKDGKLYILMYPDGVKYQFHLQTGQFMDERDIRINFDEFKKTDRYVLFSKLKFSEKEQLAAVQQDGNAIRYIKTPSEAVQLAAVR